MPLYKTNEKSKDGLTKYKVRINYTDSFGKHKQLTRTAYGLAEAKELERVLTKETSQSAPVSTITVDQLYKEYITQLKYEVRVTTIVKKESAYRCYIKDILEDKRLTQLNIKVLTAWKNSVDDKDLKLRTKQNAYKELRAMLNYAVKMEYLQNNPLIKVGNFKDAYSYKSEIMFYTPEQFKEYISIALADAHTANYFDYYVFFNIAYYTGARKGEIHSLRWSDLDSFSSIKINKSISQKVQGGDIETPPKNHSSNRDIQIPTPLANILKEHKKRQKQVAKSYGIKWSENYHITGLLKPLRDSNIANENIKYAKNANLHRIRIHDFRHSHASLLINNNINVLEVSRRLGHSNIEMTLNTYSHFFPKEEEKALQILNNIV